MTPSLFARRAAYKPFWYPWAYQAFVESEQMHWLAREVPLNQDVQDWKTRLSPDEQGLLTQIFRFFTQADVDVAECYIDRYLPLFKPVELRMMMASIAAREAVHIQAYSTLIDEIGMPEAEYAAFMDYQAMREKHEFMSEASDGLDGLARDIAVFSAFGEGLQLFASFVILLNFTRFGKMKGMGQIVSWSIRDESHHVASMVQVFHALLDEHPELWTPELRQRITDACVRMVEMEDRFIDLAYGEAEVEGLTADEVKSYIRYIADRRLAQLGLPAVFGVVTNPLPWVDVIVSGKEHTNFFENRATDYAKASVTGSWDDAFAEFDAPAAPKDDWLVLAKPGCPYCDHAQELLASLGHSHRIEEHTTEEQIAAFKAQGHRTFPQVYHNGTLIGGYDDLHEYLTGDRPRMVASA
jgi:ribonucleoside-diphosphate reductase beta chain